MADGPAGFTRGFTCPALLRIPLGFIILRIRDYHPLRCGFPAASPRLNLAMSRSYNPRPTGMGLVWALPRSLATTGGITFCFLFLLVLRCFSSQRLPLTWWGNGPSVRWVAPFRNPRIKGCLHLPAAFRSLPRLSSPSGAQASTVRPFLLSPLMSMRTSAYTLEFQCS